MNISTIDARAVFDGYPGLLTLYEYLKLHPQHEICATCHFTTWWRKEFWKNDDITVEIRSRDWELPLGADVSVQFRITFRGLQRLLKLGARLHPDVLGMIDYCCLICAPANEP